MQESRKGNKLDKNQRKILNRVYRTTPHRWGGKFWTSDQRREWAALLQLTSDGERQDG